MQTRASAVRSVGVSMQSKSRSRVSSVQSSMLITTQPVELLCALASETLALSSVASEIDGQRTRVPGELLALRSGWSCRQWHVPRLSSGRLHSAHLDLLQGEQHGLLQELTRNSRDP